MSSSEPAVPESWATLQERGIYQVMRLMFWALRILRRPLLIPIVRVVTSYFFLFGRPARAASLDYLRRVSRAAPDAGLHPDWWTSFRHFSAFGDAILDKFDAWAGRLTLTSVSFENYGVVRQAIDAGTGGLIIGAHLGNLEVCRALAGINKRVKLNVLAHTRHATNINRLLGMAGAVGFELLQVTEFDMALAFTLRERIAAGEWAVITGDRVPVHGDRTVQVKLLGEPAPLPIGPYVLAALLDCPVYLVFCLRRGGRNHIYFEKFAERVAWSRRERDAVIAGLARRFAERLEHYMKLEPLQWFNFYPFWCPASPAASPSGGLRQTQSRLDFSGKPR